MRKECFRKNCIDAGLDFAAFQFGTTSIDRKADRIKCKHSYAERSAEKRFVIGYFRADSLYAVWDLKEPKAEMKSNFSTSRSKATKVQGDEVLTVLKSVEYSGWNEETVYVFRREGIQRFLNEYAVQMLQKEKL